MLFQRNSDHNVRKQTTDRYRKQLQCAGVVQPMCLPWQVEEDTRSLFITTLQTARHLVQLHQGYDGSVLPPSYPALLLAARKQPLPPGQLCAGSSSQHGTPLWYQGAVKLLSSPRPELGAGKLALQPRNTCGDRQQASSSYDARSHSW